MSKRAILYARVSTDDQAEKGYSLPTQLEALRDYAARHGFTVVCEITDDFSGAKLDRPGLDQARSMLKAGEADAIVVYSPDRFTRNLAHSLILREELQRVGVELHYCNRGKSEDTAEGRMTENIEAVFGDYWREKIMEASKRGRRAKAAAGNWVGEGHPPFGYRKVGKGRDSKLEIDPTESAIVIRIFSLYLGTRGLAPMGTVKIAERLQAEGVPTTGRGQANKKGWWGATVREIIKRRAYMGEFSYWGKTISLPHLAIIDSETWDRAQAQSVANTRFAKRNCKHEYLLRGRLTCTCEGRMSGRTGNQHKAQPYPHYFCHRKYKEKHIYNCRERYISATSADDVVWSWLSELFLHPDKMSLGLQTYADRQMGSLQTARDRLSVLEHLIRQSQDTVNQFARDLRELGKAKDMEAARAAVKSEMQSASRLVASLTEEQEKLTAQLSSVEMTTEKQAQILKWADEIRQGLADGDVDFEAKRRMVDLLDVQGKVEYRDDVRGLFMRCVLHYADKWLPLGTFSSTTYSLFSSWPRRALPWAAAFTPTLKASPGFRSTSSAPVWSSLHSPMPNSAAQSLGKWPGSPCSSTARC